MQNLYSIAVTSGGIKTLRLLSFLLLFLGSLKLSLDLLVLLNQLFDLEMTLVRNGVEKYSQPTYLVGRQDLDLGLVVLPGEGGQLNLLRGQLGHVQGLGEDLDGQVQRLAQTGLVLLVLLLQHGDSSVPVVANTSGLPASIVSWTEGFEHE